MSIKDYLDKMKTNQNNILSFLEEEIEIEEKLQNIIDFCDNQNIHEDYQKLKLFMRLIIKIANNHSHLRNFYYKIEQILLLFKNDLIKNFSNYEIFNIFKSNKRIVLFLIEEKIMTIDENIIHTITKEFDSNKYIKADYLQYFLPEIRDFINEKSPSRFMGSKWIQELKNELPENFYENRIIGENDALVCKLIRDDLVNEFIEYIMQNRISVNSIIEPSIYETNSFLIQKKINSNGISSGISLINYAAFFGSIKIFEYLQNDEAELNSSIWDYAIHGQNDEIVRNLEENKIEPKGKDYKFCFIESIKCHHNELAHYIANNYIFTDNVLKNIHMQLLKYYNFAFIERDIINESNFLTLCKYDYYYLVEFLLKNKSIDINKIILINFIKSTISLPKKLMSLQTKIF